MSHFHFEIDFKTFNNICIIVSSGKLMDSIEHPPKLSNISLQHSGGGNIFALACNDDILRIYDIRNSTSREFNCH